MIHVHVLISPTMSNNLRVNNYPVHGVLVVSPIASCFVYKISNEAPNK